MSLEIDTKNGIAYQKVRSRSVTYGKQYWKKLKAYDSKPKRKKAVTLSRIEIVQYYCSDGNIFDYGCGTCHFIKELSKVKKEGIVDGYDVNRLSTLKLVEMDCLGHPEDLEHYQGITFWDVLEHLPEPAEVLKRVSENAYVFLSIPIFPNLEDIKKSKHYRPNEHYWYFTHEGIKNFMKQFGLSHVQTNNSEIMAGREDIYTFVFKKDDNETTNNRHFRR